MSDLISRKKVISVLEQLEEHSLSGKMDISNAIYLLEIQPTAYDIDKVVEELEEVHEKFCKNVVCGGKSRCELCEYCEEYIMFNKNIKIVKQGGVRNEIAEQLKAGVTSGTDNQQ